MQSPIKTADKICLQMLLLIIKASFFSPPNFCSLLREAGDLNYQHG